jgi:hypothetical protein
MLLLLRLLQHAPQDGQTISTSLPLTLIPRPILII